MAAAVHLSQRALLTLIGVLPLLNLAQAQASDRNVRVVEVAKDAKPMAARTDSNGTIHVVYDSPDGPQYAASTDGGKTLGAPIAIVDRAARKPGLVFTIWDMAVAPDGRVHVALGTNAWKLKLPKEEWAFFYASLAPKGAAFSPVRNLNHKPSEGFSLAADGKGNVTACWLSGKLYASVSHDEGATFGEAAEIDPAFNPCDCCTTSACYGKDGKLAVLYREETNNDRDMHLVLWDQASKKISRTQVSTMPWKIDGCPMTYFGVTPRRDGYLAVWPTKGEIYFGRLDANGGLLTPAEIATPGRSGMRTGISAVENESGETLVAWKFEGQVQWQLYDESDRAIGEPGKAKSGGAGLAIAVTKDGEFVVFR